MDSSVNVPSAVKAATDLAMSMSSATLQSIRLDHGPSGPVHP